MTVVIKKHRNKNDYLATPSGLWVRDFGKAAVPLDINALTLESEYVTLTRNELENRDFNLPAIDTQRVFAPNVLVLSDGPEVGVDVEQESDRDVDRLGEMVLSAPERDVLMALPPDQRRRGFHAYWCRKEALLKATGHGLAAPMTAIHVSAPGEPAEVLSWDDDKAVSPVRLADLTPGPGYAASLAVLTARPLKITETPVA